MSNTDLDELLRQDAISWRQRLDPPADLDAHLEQLRGSDARRHRDRRRWLVPALAAATVVILVAVGLGLGTMVWDAPGPSGQSGHSVLSSQDRALALHVAHREAEGSNPKHPGPIVAVRGWPDYVHSVSATVMTRDQALRYLDNSTANVADVRVLVIEMHGRFGFVTSGPSEPDAGSHRSPIEHGTALIVVASLAPSHYGDVTDAGLSAHHRPLPDATTVYSR